MHDAAPVRGTARTNFRIDLPPDAHTDPQAYCTALTRASGSNFYYAFRTLERPRRDALFVIYAFCRFSDDIVDEGDDPKVAAQRLAHWKKEWEAAAAGHPSHPITIRLKEVVDEYAIDPRLPHELIDGMAMDLMDNGRVRYATFSALSAYCYRAASVVGRMCVRVFGCADAGAERFADAHGMAFQLTNIVRDVFRDAENDRIYLPVEDMARFGVTEADILARRDSPALRELLAFEAARAKEFYEEARTIARRLPAGDRRALLPSRIMGAIYEAILTELTEREFRVMPPVSLSAPRKLYLAGRAWLDHISDRW